ncbi:MAG: hypothetical protein Q8K57_18220, partial [Thiobacillus sp.]|nr:hypothetical protein [Thiobacillus sp.]
MSNPSVDNAWETLRPMVEWAEGFVPIFLFSANAESVRELRIRLDQALRLSTRRLKPLLPDTPEEIARVVDKLLDPKKPLGQPVWLELTRHADHPARLLARQRLLGTLNEKRFLLEQCYRQPLVLVLPPEDKRRLHALAPDLWAVRGTTLDVRPSGDRHPVLAFGDKHEAIAALDRMQRALTHPAATAATSAAEREWMRQTQATQNFERISLADGFVAFEDAMERGALNAAKEIAGQTLAFARQSVARQTTSPQALRDLSISLDNVGQVSRDLGDLEAARTAYEESLALRRQLRASLG